MSKLQHMDFLLKKNEYSCIKIRFYPQKSHMHSFNDDPPLNYNEVYKVYYSWGILEAINNYSNERGRGCKKVFTFDYDENSALSCLDQAIKHVIRYKNKKMVLQSVGQPGSNWNIYYNKYYGYSEDDFEEIHIPQMDYLVFEVWNNCSNQGYKFDLSVETAKEFSDFISDVNKHMLENGEPI